MTQERSLLCQMAMDSQVYFGAGVRGEHFSEGPARRVYDTIGKVYAAGNTVDSFMMRDRLDESTYEWYRTQVSGAVPSSANWSHYRDAVVAAYRERRVLEITAEGQTRSGDPGAIDWCIRELASIDGASGDIVEQRDFIGEYINEVERRVKLKGTIPGIGTGFEALDNVTNGFQDRRMIIIGARPSNGKTALMTTMVANMARVGVKCGIVSVESSRHELTERIMSNMASIENTDLATGRLKPADFKGLTDTAGRMQSQEWGVTICDNPYLGIDAIKARVREMVITRGANIVFVDYIQRIPQTDFSIPFRLHMAQCSTAFKSLATELDIPVVVLSQIGRDGEGGHPRLSNLKETGQLEQDADIAILIAELEDGLHLDVAKNRDGKKTVLPVEFIGKYMRFYGGRDDSRWM